MIVRINHHDETICIDGNTANGGRKLPVFCTSSHRADCAHKLAVAVTKNTHAVVCVVDNHDVAGSIERHSRRTIQHTNADGAEKCAVAVTHDVHAVVAAVRHCNVAVAVKRQATLHSEELAVSRQSVTKMQ